MRKWLTELKPETWNHTDGRLTAETLISTATLKVRCVAACFARPWKSSETLKKGKLCATLHLKTSNVGLSRKIMFLDRLSSKFCLVIGVQ